MITVAVPPGGAVCSCSSIGLRPILSGVGFGGSLIITVSVPPVSSNSSGSCIRLRPVFSSCHS